MVQSLASRDSGRTELHLNRSSADAARKSLDSELSWVPQKQDTIKTLSKTALPKEGYQTGASQLRKTARSKCEGYP